jgi:hypothetical protein
MWCIVGCYGQLIMLKFVLDMAESELPNKLWMESLIELLVLFDHEEHIWVSDSM